MNITGFQFRAARNGLKVSMVRLMQHTGLSVATIQKAENAGIDEFLPIRQTSLKKLLEFFGDYGIEFLPQNGVKLDVGFEI